MRKGLDTSYHRFFELELLNHILLIYLLFRYFLFDALSLVGRIIHGKRVYINKLLLIVFKAASDIVNVILNQGFYLLGIIWLVEGISCLTHWKIHWHLQWP